MGWRRCLASSQRGALQSQPLIPAGHLAGVLKMANQQGKLAELSLPPPSADVTGVQGPCPGRKSAERPTAFRWLPARMAGGAEPRPEGAGPGPEGGFSRVHTRKRGRVSAQSRWRRSHRRSRHLLLNHAGKWSRSPRPAQTRGLRLAPPLYRRWVRRPSSRPWPRPELSPLFLPLPPSSPPHPPASATLRKIGSSKEFYLGVRLQHMEAPSHQAITSLNLSCIDGEN